MNTHDVPGIVRLASKEFHITEDESTGVLQHLIEGNDLSLYGLSNAITRHSQDVENYDRLPSWKALGTISFHAFQTMEGRMREIPLTPEQKTFAEKHHGLVYKFLNKNQLSADEFYDVVIFGYLRAVRRFLRRQLFKITASQQSPGTVCVSIYSIIIKCSFPKKGMLTRPVSTEFRMELLFH